jgi:hypothetical protein
MTSRKAASRPARGIVATVSEAVAEAVVLAARFAAGMHMDGKARSDSTFWHRGTTGPAHWWGTGEPSRWAKLAGWHRLAVRLAAVALLVGWLRWRSGTEWVLVLTGGPAAGIGAWRVGRSLRSWRHVRQLVRPLSSALAPFLGVGPADVEDVLELRPDFEDTLGGEHVGSLGLPDHWAATPDQKTPVEQVIAARLGIDLRYQWRTAQYPMVVNLTRAPVPPATVWLEEVLEAIEQCRDGQVVLGKDASGQIAFGDFLNEDPHWGVSAGSRRGKSTLLCLTAAQILYQSGPPLAAADNDAAELLRGGVTGIDPKMTSLDALVGLPGVEIFNDPRDVQGMWAGIKAFRKVMEDRIDAYSRDKTLEFGRRLLILDEANQFAAMSADHWQAIKDPGDKAQAPVWRDVAAVGWMGAAFNCNLAIVGQRLDSEATGKANVRDSLGIRMLGGFTPQQWKFLVGTTPVPRSQKPRGRFIVVNGGEHTWVQLTRVHDGIEGEQEIRNLATRRRASSPATPVSSSDGPGGRGTAAPVPLRRSLREASSDLGAGVVPVRYEALKKARQTDPGFPEGRPTPTGTVYTDHELRAWHAERGQRAGVPQ